MIVRGDARSLPLAAGTVQCAVTSPPYWGLRDYGVTGQLGLESTPDEYVASMVGVFREVWRVLRDDGALWLNLGSSYASQGGPEPAQTKWQVEGASDGQNGGRSRTPGRFKHKDMVPIPWMVAMALQADGWYLRQDIIWAKPNPMPESVRDRCTKSHEYIFLLTKQQKYFYNADAIRDPVAPSQVGRVREDAIGGASHVERGQHSPGGVYRQGKTWEERKEMGFRGDTKHPTTDAIEAGMSIPSFVSNENGRNKRSVWTVNTQPYPEAHFATFPEKLVEPCILAGTKPGDLVLDPFAGSGTVGKVALQFNRRFVGVELNPAYVTLAQRRLTNLQPTLLEAV